LPDQVQIAIPRWMLDPLVCDHLPDEDRPRLDLPALRSLRALLDAPPRSVSESREDACVTRIPGGSDAQTETGPGRPASVAVSGRSSGDAAVPGGTSMLPAAAGPAAAECAAEGANSTEER